MKIEILRADSQDAGILTEIAIAAKRHWKYPEHWIEIWLPALTMTSEYLERHATWMAVLDHAPIGFYSLKTESAQTWLDNLWILPAHIGKGIGQMLFLHALSQSKQQGIKILHIEADPNAQGFYEKMGACKIGEHHTHVDGQSRTLPILEIAP